MTPLERESKRFSRHMGGAWYVPNYTIELIRAELERVGKWDGFVRWHVWQLHKFKEPGWGEPAGMVWILDFHLSHSASADILTTPLLLLQAASAYMEV